MRVWIGCVSWLSALTTALAFAASAAPELPKVVLVGDSIRLSYEEIVEKQLAGKAVVVGARANGGDSRNVLKHLDEWVIRERPAVVHLNCGIHDIKKSRKSGTFQVSPEQYEANLREIVGRIRKETGAVVLFATTTPILDDRAAATRDKAEYELLEASIATYNAIALKVMKELDVPVDDLHAATDGKTAEMISKDGVHFTREGAEALGKAVAAFVDDHLPVARSGGD